MGLQFRLLPLLIFVCALAFTVKLVEVFSGVRHLSGIAMAETVEAEKSKSATDSKTETKLDSAKTEASTDTKVAAKAPEKDKVKPQEKEWRDAGDSDTDVETVRLELLEDVKKRSAKLDAFDKSLKTREALLKATEQEIDRKYQELSKLRTEIEALLGKQTEEEEKRIASLVKIYEGMKPKDAARIFDTLDLDIMVSVVSKMSERKISAILGLMDPERAKTLTIMLAEQKKLPTLAQ